MLKFYLESGYHNLKIFSEHRTYLGLSLVRAVKKTFFRFKVLPFGLSTACNLFTKFTKPLIKIWRSQGFKVVLYLDDDIVVHSSKMTLKAQGVT